MYILTYMVTGVRMNAKKKIDHNIISARGKLYGIFPQRERTGG